ncbi:MAG: hypothetical protein IKF72_10465 [Kiritimatiellae bacterium]|nr:hypothetical protein [Kiritimatiellia bacterium]
MKDDWPTFLKILAVICFCSVLAYFIGYVNGKQQPLKPDIQKIIDREKSRLAEKAQDYIDLHRGRAYQSGYEDGVASSSLSKEDVDKAISNFLWKKHHWIISERIRLKKMSEDEFNAELDEARELLLRYTREDD